MWLVLLPLLLILFYLYRKSQQRLFKSLGIPGPEPHWFFGNLLCHNEDYPEALWIRDCTAQFGKIWGFYEGPVPCLVVSDPDLVQDVFVKQFSSAFHSRKIFVLHNNPKGKRFVSMMNANGERWKRLRTIVNPAFSELKMRKMFPLIKHCIDVLMAKLERESEGKRALDIYEFYKRLTLDVISECAFGVALNAQEDSGEHSVLNKIKALFGFFGRRYLAVVLAEALPEVAVIVRYLFRLLARIVPSRGGGLFIRERLKEVIEERREKPALRRTDILQLMLDAELPADAEFSSDAGEKALSKDEIVSQSMLFLIAGYETSSTALAIITHALATHPDVQERLQAEIDSFYDSSEAPEALNEKSDHLSGLTYLNQVINESLRFYPIGASVLSRQCMADAIVGGHRIPKGTNVIADVWTLHFDPAAWGPIDPQLFDPDRFLEAKKRDSADFLAFGIGPRHCIGRRFALTEVRAVLFRLLRRFNIRACARTQIPLSLKYRPTLGPRNSVDVLLEPRAL